MGSKKEKPVRRAVALKYVPRRDRAPKVTAKGSGPVAEKIIGLARTYGVPLKEDPVLAEMLSQLDFNQEIPPSVYVIVAEILAFVYSMNQKFSHLTGNKG